MDPQGTREEAFPARSKQDTGTVNGVPTEVNDFKVAAMPLGLLKKIQKGMQPAALEFDKELHTGLRNAGFQLTQGPEGAGQLIMVFEVGGGAFSRFISICDMLSLQQDTVSPWRTAVLRLCI